MSHSSERLADAAPVSFWLDDPRAPAPADPLIGHQRCDLAVVGGGYTGLWTALLAKEADPGRRVVLLDRGRCGWEASGRNGGFCSASLTHGLANGAERFPEEIDTLERLGMENLSEIEKTLARYGIECEFEANGGLNVATEAHQIDDVAAAVKLAQRHGQRAELLDGPATRALVHSPTYLGAHLEPEGLALLNPARLAWGLRTACLDLGVEIHEDTTVHSLEADGEAIVLRTEFASLRASSVALGTNAFPSLVRRVRPFIVPVYDYVLMTEPLSAAQMASIGWEGRQGLASTGNQFIYYRLTGDNRILFGGYDAVYYYGGAMGPAYEQRGDTFERLATLFAETFPQLDDVAFTHAWAGAIDTCSRFCAFFGTASKGRVAYSAGYTGLGVGASRFGARVMLDLLSGRESQLTQLAMVRTKPIPFPPEPLRWAGIGLTRWSLARADRRDGRRNLWLRTLDWAGLGFDS